MTDPYIVTKEYLACCESVISMGLQRGDYNVVARVARSALRVALSFGVEIDSLSVADQYLTACEWYERCQMLEVRASDSGRELQKEIYWATEEMERLTARINQSRPTSENGEIDADDGSVS